MGVLEADYAVVYGRIIEGARIPAPIDAYYRTVVIPGFSDTHMHPQVVDGGLSGRPWRDSYHWIEGRRLSVDEASLRADLDLSARLAAAALKRAMLEGVTLAALTGRLEANVKAYLSLEARPKVVFLPTVMKRRGWPGLREVLAARRRVAPYLRDGMARVGIFVHSIRYAEPSTLREALRISAREGVVVGMHLGEGVPEAHILASLTGRGGVPGRVVAVHCIDDDPGVYGIRCSSCPASNLILYNRTRAGLEGVTSFGSDWPLLLGTVPRHLGLMARLWPGQASRILFKATVGGYMDYGIPYNGDLVAYDAPLRDVISGRAMPRLVMVSWRPVVVDGVLVTGETYSNVLSEIKDLVAEAIERHPSGTASGDPLREASRAFEEALLSLEKGRLAQAYGNL